MYVILVLKAVSSCRWCADKVHGVKYQYIREKMLVINYKNEKLLVKENIDAVLTLYFN